MNDQFYVAVDTAEFLNIQTGLYQVNGRAFAAGHDVDALKQACYEQFVPEFMREELPDLTSLGRWTIARGTTDCHLFVDARFKETLMVIHPVKLVETKMVQP